MTPSNPRHSLIFLAASLALTFTVSLISSLATMPQIDTWYAQLMKPSWTPPNWVFGPVWGVLYAMMSVAVWLVWRKAGWRDGRRALIFYAIQLVLNLGWTLIFFAARSILGGLIEIVLFWMFVGLTIHAFRQHSQTAAWLLAPYWLWVTYASTLNIGILIQNS